MIMTFHPISCDNNVSVRHRLSTAWGSTSNHSFPHWDHTAMQCHPATRAANRWCRTPSRSSFSPSPALLDSAAWDPDHGEQKPRKTRAGREIMELNGDCPASHVSLPEGTTGRAWVSFDRKIFLLGIQHRLNLHTYLVVSACSEWSPKLTSSAFSRRSLDRHSPPGTVGWGCDGAATTARMLKWSAKEMSSPSPKTIWGWVPLVN